MLGPYHGDLNKVEHPNEFTQTELDEADHRAETVKKEVCSDSVWIEVENAHDQLVIADRELLISDHKVKLEPKLLDDDLCKAVKIEPVASVSGQDEQVYETQYSLKFENMSFGCTLCFREFAHEHEHDEHMSFHLQAAAADGDCDTSQTCENCTESSSRGDSSDAMVYRRAAQKPDDVSIQSTNFAQTAVPSLTQKLSTNKVIKVLPTKAKSDTHKSRKQVLEFIIASMNNKCEAGGEKKVLAAENRSSRQIQNETDCLSNDIKPQFNLLPGYSLRTHIDKKCFICDFCQRKFKLKKLLVKHIKSHTDIKPLSYMFSQDECNLDRQHIRTPTIEKPYSCELCSYKSTRKYDLVRHMQTHTGEQPYSCKLCKYKFLRNSNLVRHMRTHTGERPYSCQVCKYKFVRNSDLVRHMRAHTGEKPYSCTLCDYKCATKNNLVLHMRTHTGVKPYPCKLCEYKSAYKHRLVLHMRTHTGEKPFSCKLCEYKCAHKSNLVRHMRTQHG